MAKKQAYKYRIVYYVGIILTVACLVLAIYHLNLSNNISYSGTKQQQQLISYVLFGVAGGLLCAQLLVAIIGSAKRHSAFGFVQWWVSFAVIIVTIIIFALLPLIFVMWLVEILYDGISNKRSKRIASQQNKI